VFSAGGIMVAKYHRLLLRRLPSQGRVARVGEQLGASIVVLSGQKIRLVMCLALSLLVQCAFVVATIGFANAAEVHVPVAAWFFAWPLSKLIATLPISIAGLGVREASLAGLLVPFGAPAAAIVGVGLLWQTIQFSGALLGGLFVLISRYAIADGSAPNALEADTNDVR